MSGRLSLTQFLFHQVWAPQLTSHAANFPPEDPWGRASLLSAAGRIDTGKF
jgi:hypothetical protein